MTRPVDRLLAVLESAAAGLSPAEVAEAIWLATRVDLTGQGHAAGVRPRQQPDPDAGTGGSGQAQADLRLPVPESPAAPQEPPRPEPRDDPAGGAAGPPAPPDRPAGGTPGPAGEAAGPLEFPAVAGWPLLVRTAAALPNSGRVMRALRPLKRNGRTGPRVTIDEDATARQIAERRLWTPVWRPADNRWLHLTLVLDHSAVGGVWTRLGQEVRILLEQLGAFRTMRVVQLGLRDDGTLGLFRRDGRPGPPRAPWELADRPGGHLLLVLSDCVGAPWRDGAMSALLGHWARRAPVAVLQPLPERFWPRTGLDPLPGRLCGPQAGAPAARYAFTSALRRRGLPTRSVPVPVLELEPQWLRPWANLVAGRAVGGIDAIVTPAGGTVAARPAGVPRQPSEPGAEQRVRDFRAGASTAAYDLARYLSAAVPLNVAVMRVVQAVMVPGSRPSHLAEVLYGGLLQPLSEGGRTADEQPFEFLPGVRQVLMGTLLQADAGRVLTEVSDFVERHLERAGASFAAVVSAPMGTLTVPALRQPFARVRSEVLRRLAGSTVPVGDHRGPPAASRDPGSPHSLTVLHLNGLDLNDLDTAVTGDRRPDLVVVTGGVAERATPAEYEAAYLALEELRERLGLPDGRIVVVPGVSDVNEGRCRAYFLDQEADGRVPVPPYWKKWEPFAGLTGRLRGAAKYEPHQPWQFFPIAEARTVVAALNSTIPVSHLPGSRYGELGPDQMHWFADRLREYERRGWLRVGVVHHDPTGGGDTGLHDAAAFARLLAPHLDVVLHGHPGGVREIGFTGVPAVGMPAPAAAAGHRRQVISLRPGRLVVSPGEDGRPGVPHSYGDHWWLAEAGFPAVVTATAGGWADTGRTDLVARVARAYRARTPAASIVERPWPGPGPAGPMLGYLLVSSPRSSECIGVCAAAPGVATVRRFLEDVVQRQEERREATLVWSSGPGGGPAGERVVVQGVRLVDFADFQLGDDVLRYAGAQAASLADDPAFPSELYVPQPYTGPGGAGTDLLVLLRRLLADPAAGRMVAVVGASGTGKTFLLRELARRLHADRDPVVPILVDLRNLDWRVGLDQLVAIHLARGGIREVDLDRSRYLLREGRVVLLCDGLDDLAARSSHDRLRDWLSGWEAGARIRSGPAKVILVSRDGDLLTDALAPYVAAGPPYRVDLDGFEPEQILGFLTRRLGGERARARLELLGRVGGLLGMARNPRMLAFIAGIDDRLLLAAASGAGPVTVTALYQDLIDDWLDGERRRASAVEDAAPVSLADLRRAVTYLARRLWESGETALGADALGAAADVLARLGGARGAGSPGRGAAARLLGAGTLLNRDQEYRFHFVDHSLLEWLVAREIADHLEPGRPAGRLRSLLRREMSPLMMTFLLDLAGHDTARAWAEANAGPSAPEDVRAVARRILEAL